MPKSFRTSFSACGLPILLIAISSAPAQDPKTPYPNMAPLEQYLMDRDAEIALARTAAAQSLTADAEVIVLGKHGYETAIRGKNGFVCMVERSWTADFDAPEFWNPKLRSAICYNPPAVHSVLPLVLRKTDPALAGRPKKLMAQTIRAAIEKKELPGAEPGAMAYMLSRQGNLNDHVGHWHPHLMFFVPSTQPLSWGAELPGSPILATQDELAGVTVFMIPVAQWSDGTADDAAGH